jgi:glycogen debranching enzyme
VFPPSTLFVDGGNLRQALSLGDHLMATGRTMLMTATPDVHDTRASSGESPSLKGSGQLVTLVEETSFCLSAAGGDIEAGSAHGLFFLDTRFLSSLVLRVNGSPVESLAVANEGPFAATFFGRVGRPLGPPRSEGSVIVFRRRHIGRGLVERIELRNHGPEPMVVVVELAVETDFADLFSVKERRAGRHHPGQWACTDRELCITGSGDHEDRSVTITFSEPGEIGPGQARWEVELPSQGSWEVCLEVVASINGEEIEPRYRCGEPTESSAPVRRLSEWQAAMPVIATDSALLETALTRASEDLGALRIVDPDHPDDVIIAAGAPWYMTVFGRDSLITAYMSLIVDPDVALGVLRTLARLQGTRFDPDTEEEPGRILHEIRFHDRPSWSLGDGTIYYGTADATPLFVLLLGELRRWGLAPDAVEELLPHADRALEWIENWGDRDGDGYVEYHRHTDKGLQNQGWKDSWDAIRFSDGTFAEGPIAMCEVQAYVYAAYLARAYFADEHDEAELAVRFREKAANLKAAFNRDFWLADKGYVAMALDGDKRPVDALSSNMGHCLMTGILDEDKAAMVADHLLSPELFSGWGVRTLATSMSAYNPVSYHNGSVWPHDNAIIVAGLVRYGFTGHAHRIVEALLEVSELQDGRLPELFSGVDRSELSVPAPYPTSCVPQAWAAASPFLFLRSLLRFDPWMGRRRLWVAPELPPSIRQLVVSRIPLGERLVTVSCVDNRVEVTGVGDDVEVEVHPRSALTASIDPNGR